jgi:ATP/maltotriose-dependent transcriptional regulator MalT/DNA-binding SARP family transcriptional activator
LFAWLDDHYGVPMLWLAGAPGAGKTTLVASYLRARERPYLWYRLDGDDNDLGQFFSTLGMAIEELAGKKVSRPAFAAELAAQPQRYVRAWFRAVFATLPRPAMLVFDNVEQAALAALPMLLASAIDEAPAGVTLLVTARHAPPPDLAAARLAGLLAELPAAGLAFTEEEATQYALALGLDPQHVRAASRSVAGWAAALCLLSRDANTSVPDARAPQAAFDYLAGVLFDRLDSQGQQLLLVAALLPWVPAALLAKLVQPCSPTTTIDTQMLLDRLCAQHLFVEHVEASAGVYRLHPLLRDFLRERGRRSLAPTMRQALLHEAALAFGAQGQRDVELDLLLEAGDADAAARCLTASIEGRLASGRLDQLAAWFAQFPPAVLDRHPTLRYGQARLCFLREDAAALEHYEHACGRFAEQGDLFGQRLCAAGVLEWRYNTDSFVDHERWVDLLRRPEADGATAIAEPQALRLLNGHLLAAFYGGDFEPQAARLTDAVLAVLTPGGAENEKLSAAITLLGCLERHKRWDDAQLLAERMEAMLESPQLGPRMKILVRQQIAADLHRQCGAYGEARRLALASRAEAREHGYAVLEYEAVAEQLLAALYSGDDAEVRLLLADLDALCDARNFYHQRFAHHVHAWHALQTGRIVAAREHADALRAAIARSAMPAAFSATWLLNAVLVRHAAGDECGARAEMQSLAAQAETGSRATLDANRAALDAWCASRDGRREAALDALREAWSLAAPRRYYQLLGPLRGSLAQLADLALDAGIEPAFSRELIQRRRLKPASLASPAWPWPLRITTLGAFALAVDGEPLRFDGAKAPKKPLALLKALVAFGGAGVPEAALADALWPDEEADAAHDALNVALHRLRKLLPQGAERLRLHDGRLDLDADSVWIDCRAFEQLVAEADAKVTSGAVLPVELLHRALALYRGHFLATDADQPWTVSARERLRSKFGRVVAACGQALVATGRDHEALAVYKRGLETDEFDEQLYQGVMRCAIALKRPAEGIAAYRRCQRVLTVLIGVAPSIDTEALLRQVLAL